MTKEKSSIPVGQVDDQTNVDEYTKHMQEFLGGLEMVPATPNKDERPIFGKSELANQTNPLAKLLRMAFYTLNLSTKGFKARFQAFATRHCYSTAKATSTCNNSIRAMQNPNMTYRTFEDLLMYTNFHISDMSVTLTDLKTGQTLTVSLKNAHDAVEQETLHQNTAPKDDNNE